MGVHSRYNVKAEVRDDGSLAHTKVEEQIINDKEDGSREDTKVVEQKRS